MPTPSGFPTSQDLINAQKDVEHLGRVVNSEDAQGNPTASSTNRTGGTNKTLDALQAEYQSAIQAAGGVPLGTWSSGVTYNAYNEYLVYNGIPYKPAASTTLPYTTQGSDPTVAPDEGLVIPFAEVTRSDVVLNVASISELLSVQPTGDGFKVNVASYHEGWAATNDAPKGGGVFVWDSSRPKSDHNGGTVIDPDAPFPTLWGDASQQSTWFESSNPGSGCWIKSVGTEIEDYDFGVVADGSSDDTLPLQKSIEYCAPYVWKGSVSASKNFDKTRASLLSGEGTRRITGTLLLSPFLSWSGIASGGFFGGKSSKILADFDGLSIVDAAPYNQLGQRNLGVRYSRTDWDSGDNVGCPGWALTDLTFAVSTGKNITWGVNRVVSQQSHITRIGVTGTEVGIRTNVTWGGSIRDSHIIAKTYGLENTRDVTVDIQGNNYLTITGQGPSTYSDLQWPDDNIIKAMTAGIFQNFSNVTYINNIIEGSAIGIKATQSTKLREIGTYFEGVTDYCYAVHSIGIDVAPAWLVVPGKVIYCRSAGGTINLAGTSYTGYTDFADFGGMGNRTVNVMGHFPDKYSSYLRFPRDHAENCEIFVSGSGDDSNMGYTDNAPVKTINEAIVRCVSGVSNVITLLSDAGTTYTLLDGQNVTNYSSEVTGSIVIDGGGYNLNVGVTTAGDQAHAIQFSNLGSLKFKDVNTILPETTSADYRAFVRPRNNLSFIYEGGSVVGGGGDSALIGSSFSQGGSAAILLRDATLTNFKLVEDASQFSDSYLMWYENNEGCTFSGVTTDDGMKIKSKQFP